MEEQAFKNGYVLPSGLTVEEAEHASRSNVEAIYIKAFASGHSMLYRDERCTEEKHMVRSNPDGSEDLVVLDWQNGSEKLVKLLASSGQGKYAYLLHDPRYLNLKEE